MAGTDLKQSFIRTRYPDFPRYPAYLDTDDVALTQMPTAPPKPVDVSKVEIAETSPEVKKALEEEDETGGVIGFIKKLLK